MSTTSTLNANVANIAAIISCSEAMPIGVAGWRIPWTCPNST